MVGKKYFTLLNVIKIILKDNRERGGKKNSTIDIIKGCVLHEVPKGLFITKG